MEQIPTNEANQIASTELLRNKTRHYSKCQREHQRVNNEDSVRFGLGEIKSVIKEFEELTEKDVICTVQRIKRRKHATPNDMYRLSYAFLQDLSNIITFNKTTGALQVLIKELSGKDTECQVRAAECFCNLSLGGSPVCDKIVTIAGSYLVTYLHSTEIELVRLCLWTISNILACINENSSFKSYHTLMQMELLPQLWKLYVSENGTFNPSIEYNKDAALCLQLIALNPLVHTQAKYCEFFLQHGNEKKLPTICRTTINDGSEYHLQIIFHTLFHNKDNITKFSKSFSLYLVNYAINSILLFCPTHSYSSDLIKKGNIQILYAIRILSNLLAHNRESSFIVLLQKQLSLNWQSDLFTLLNELFSYKNDCVTNETLWLLNNIILIMESDTSNVDGNRNYTMVNNFLDKLCINVH